MDIAPADRDKKIIRFALWYARKKLAEGKTRDEIAYDMQHCGNPIIRNLYKKICDGLDQIKEEPQRNRTKEVVEFFLWILNKDTAYRQPFFFITSCSWINGYWSFRDDEHLACWAIERIISYSKTWRTSPSFTKIKQKKHACFNTDTASNYRYFISVFNFIYANG